MLNGRCPEVGEGLAAHPLRLASYEVSDARARQNQKEPGVLGELKSILAIQAMFHHVHHGICLLPLAGMAPSFFVLGF